MITGELKNKIDRLWETFWTGGITNPLDVVEQMTYLMFIHDLDAADNQRARESAMLGLPHKSIFAGEVQVGERTIPGNQLKWSVFHDFPAGQMYSVMQEWVFPFIKNLHADKDSAYAKYMGDAIFKIPTPLMLDKIVTALDAIYAQMAQLQTSDVRGDVYEYLLDKLATAGVNGQFRTPRHIIRMMVDMMEPRADEVICDPACGTAGFLVAASEYLKEHRRQEVLFNRANKNHYMNDMFHGYDMDRTMLRIGAMNMMTHGVDNPFIEYRDSLSDQNPDREAYSLILANPPFKGSLDEDIVSTDLLKLCKTKKTELLFIALFLRMLKVGGRCACIVPDGVLFGSSTAHRAIRTELVENNRLEAVVSMPSGEVLQYSTPDLATMPTYLDTSAPEIQAWYEKNGPYLFTWSAEDQVEFSRRYEGGSLRLPTEGELTFEEASTLARTFALEQTGYSGSLSYAYPVLYAESSGSSACYVVYCCDTPVTDTLPEQSITVSFSPTGENPSIQSNTLLPSF